MLLKFEILDNEKYFKISNYFFKYLYLFCMWLNSHLFDTFISASQVVFEKCVIICFLWLIQCICFYMRFDMKGIFNLLWLWTKLLLTWSVIVVNIIIVTVIVVIIIVRLNFIAIIVYSHLIALIIIVWFFIIRCVNIVIVVVILFLNRIRFDFQTVQINRALYNQR